MAHFFLTLLPFEKLLGKKNEEKEGRNSGMLVNLVKKSSKKFPENEHFPKLFCTIQYEQNFLKTYISGNCSRNQIKSQTSSFNFLLFFLSLSSFFFFFISPFFLLFPFTANFPLLISPAPSFLPPFPSSTNFWEQARQISAAEGQIWNVKSSWSRVSAGQQVLCSVLGTFKISDYFGLSSLYVY